MYGGGEATIAYLKREATMPDARPGPTSGGGCSESAAGGATTGKVSPKRKAKPRSQHKVQQLPKFHVVLLNDDDHTYDYVIGMLADLFAHPPERGYQLAKAVDTKGRAVVLTTHKEHAELKREQIHAYGLDTRVAACKGSMRAVIEPAA